MREQTSSRVRSQPSRAERRLSFALLGLLLCIGLAVVAVQFRYDPSLWRARQTDLPPSAALPGSGAGAAPVAGVRALSAPERYDARTLSDKIDGKAELYLGAGFESLETQRYALQADPGRWLELFIYDMGRPAGAFSVYSQQRRQQAQALDLAAEAYRSANGIFLAHDRFYLEIVGSDESPQLVEKMTALAGSFIALHPVAAAAADADERDFFPENGRVPDSIALTAQKAFGFEPFDRMFTAQYSDQNRSAAAFVSRRASAEEAAGLAQAYAAYLIEYGAERVAPPPGAPPLAIFRIMDSYEIVLQRGDVLAGVHEADDLPFALALAEQLHRRLVRGTP